MSARRSWTADEIRALGTRTDLVTACQIVYGCGKNRAWELYHSNRLPFRALRVGRRVVVPTAPLLALLCLTPDMSEAGVATPAAATTDVPTDTRTAPDVPPF